jgi:hypothetical protein
MKKLKTSKNSHFYQNKALSMAIHQHFKQIFSKNNSKIDY